MSRLTKYNLLAAATAVALSAAGNASPPKEPKALPSKTVSVGKLDLRKDEDVARLKRRVVSAAYHVCTHDALGRFIGPPAHDRATCHAEAMASAMVSLNRLTETARAKPMIGRTPVGFASVTDPANAGEQR